MHNHMKFNILSSQSFILRNEGVGAGVGVGVGVGRVHDHVHVRAVLVVSC